MKASGPAGAAGGRHLPRLRIVCGLFLEEGKRGQRSVGGRYSVASFAKGFLPGQESIDGETVVLASSG